VNLKWLSVERYLVNLFVFLIPTQLALHFWLPGSFVFGIRVDYLAPSIYLTDILFVLIVAVWMVQERSMLLRNLETYKKYIVPAAVFIALNIFVSANWPITLFRWVRLAEFFFIFCYFKLRAKKINLNVAKIIFCSLILFSLIGVSQVVLGGTVGGLLYYLGERNFNISTPGIALAQINGAQFLRAYSTFSHPNSFAGYAGVAIIYLLINNFFARNMWHLLGYGIILLSLVLTNSVWAILSLTIVAFLILIRKKANWSAYGMKSLILLIIALSIITPLVASKYPGVVTALASTVGERVGLSIIALKMIGENFFLGVGLGNFIGVIPNYLSGVSGPWLLQPVHNIYLLFFSETGIIGLVALLNLLWRKAAPKFYAIIVFVLLTGALDHYWATLQQNGLLLALILGVL
jgi:O-antigen ligase